MNVCSLWYVRNKTRYYMDEDTIVRYYRQSGLISYDE